MAFNINVFYRLIKNKISVYKSGPVPANELAGVLKRLGEAIGEGGGSTIPGSGLSVNGTTGKIDLGGPITNPTTVLGTLTDDQGKILLLGGGVSLVAGAISTGDFAMASIGPTGTGQNASVGVGTSGLINKGININEGLPGLQVVDTDSRGLHGQQLMTGTDPLDYVQRAALPKAFYFNIDVPVSPPTTTYVLSLATIGFTFNPGDQAHGSVVSFRNTFIPYKWNVADGELTVEFETAPAASSFLSGGIFIDYFLPGF